MSSVSKEDLRGLKSPSAYQVMFTLLLGYYSVPVYGDKKSFKEFLEDFSKMEREERQNILNNAISVTPLKEEEYMNCLYFCKDGNGIRYTKENVSNLTYQEIMHNVVDVCLAVSDCEVFF